MNISEDPIIMPTVRARDVLAHVILRRAYAIFFTEPIPLCLSFPSLVCEREPSSLETFYFCPCTRMAATRRARHPFSSEKDRDDTGKRTSGQERPVFVRSSFFVPSSLHYYIRPSDVSLCSRFICLSLRLC